MTIDIIVCARREVDERLARHQPAAVLSIEHPGVSERDAAPRLTCRVQKILCFWDSEEPVAAGPDMAQVQAGMDFIVEQAQRGPVLVHCHAGKARSCGVVLGALALLQPDATPQALVAQLKAIRPEAAPNILVVELADRAAGRGGALLAAVLADAEFQAARERTAENRRRWLEKNPEVWQRMNPEKAPPKNSPKNP